MLSYPASLAKARALGERANATLKCWKILTKLRCCPQRATPILAAITAGLRQDLDMPVLIM